MGVNSRRKQERKALDRVQVELAFAMAESACRHAADACDVLLAFIAAAERGETLTPEDADVTKTNMAHAQTQFTAYRRRLALMQRDHVDAAPGVH